LALECEVNKPRTIVFVVEKYASSGNILTSLAKDCPQRFEWEEAIKFVTMAMTKGKLEYPNEA